MFEAFFNVLLQRRTFALVFILELGLLWVIYLNVYHIDRLTGLPILDMEFGYSIERVNEILGGYTAEARARYEIIQIADFIHPVIYSVLLAGLIWSLADGERWRWLFLLPLMVALFDYAENVMIFRMTSENLPVDAATAQMSSVLSLIKHSLMAASVAALLMMFVRRLLQALFY